MERRQIHNRVPSALSTQCVAVVDRSLQKSEVGRFLGLTLGRAVSRRSLPITDRCERDLVNSASPGEYAALVHPTSAATVEKSRSTPLSVAQTRVITAAMDLFARYGVGGTSLQMIADEIGVTKAAVYHQYKSKDEIILAAAESELGRLEAVIEVAEMESSSKRAR